ncbi:MAG: hypothetical protein CM15mP109_01040 [Candidatus Dadabacteria bacterium]|nr:MAG: hypothetical protein CM15mP109_01040 [Candidatus Dadabacteria bacterium]
MIIDLCFVAARYAIKLNVEGKVMPELEKKVDQKNKNFKKFNIIYLNCKIDKMNSGFGAI